MCIEASDLKRLESLILDIQQTLTQQRFKREWYSVKEAALELGLNVQTVRSKCRTEQLTPRRKREGVTRFGKAEWEVHHSAIEHYKNHKWAKGDSLNGGA